jgi:uncharacterized protein involved in outer membrane biogenesis
MVAKPGRGRRLRGVLIGVAVLVVLYAMSGFLIAPRVVRGRLVRQVSATLHRPATVGRVKVNPFTLSVTVDSLRVADRDGAELLGWDEFYINLELSSIVLRELHFAEVRLVRPYGRVVIRRDGTLNVSDIADSLRAAPSAGPLPVVEIDGLHIDGARVDFVDSATPRTFATTIGPWRIDLASFATRRDINSRYSFSGRTESGESFAWAGTVGIDPLRSEGDFSLDSLKLEKYGPFYERTVGFDVARGTASVKAQYQVNFGPAGRVMRLSTGTLRVGGLALVERGHVDTAVTISTLEIAGVTADALSRRATVGAVITTGGVLRVSRSRDSTINVLRMLATPRDSAAPSAAARAPARGKAAPPWRWLVGRVAADGYAVQFVDSAGARPASITLASVVAALDTIASESAAVTKVRASIAWQPRGTLRAEGSVAIWQRTGDLAISAYDLSLRPLDAFLGPAVNLRINDGRLTADTRVRFDLRDALRPDVGFTGNVRVDRFVTVDGARKEPFFSFRSLRLTAIDYAMRAKTLRIREIALDGPTLIAGIAANGTPVMRTVFPSPGGDSARSDSMPNDSMSKDSARRDSAPPPPPAPAARPAAKGKAPLAAPPGIRTNIGRVRVTGGLVRLDDRSQSPPVLLTISKIDATTGRLSSDSLGVGTLDLTASIDDVAPVKVHGSFNPLSSKEGSDLTVNMQGMELIPVGSYSGRFLGYQIAKGKMRLDMQYRVMGRQLKSENKLTLDQFEFGDKTNSPEATHMPVKLGFAVLRDRNGEIVFDVPIEGNLDDPNFRFGRVIGRAILNVLTKLVTSPFKLLGGMFGGSSTADLSYVGFAAGSAELSVAETKKLDVLAKSLYERPALKLEIAGAVDTVADPAALRAAKLDAQLRQRMFSALTAKGAKVPPADSLTITPVERSYWLAAAFAAAYPADSAVVAAKRAKRPAPPYPDAEMERRLLASISIAPGELQALAGARAKGCQEYILSRPGETVEAERVFLTAGSDKTSGAKVEFNLQ